MDEDTEMTRGRRTFLGAVVVAPVAVMLGGRRAQAQPPLPHLAAGDPQARAYGYVDRATTVKAAGNPTYKPGEHCGNCALVQGSAAATWRPCRIFPGKLVNSGGWCRVWTPKQ
ncbi:MAG TPA: high-potential iron-sulfur protein [Steroidobacteraceae bacterium]|nr:high-potential iron-sulfur protein [Steroidobacteraceae bacterium]